MPPTTTLAEAGVTLTLATGTGVTVIVAVPVIPSTVAVIVALPAATAVTTPAALTVATAGVPLLHVTARPVSAFPAASRAPATRDCVPPTTTLAEAGVTLTLATAAGGGGVVPPPPPPVPGSTGWVPPPSAQARVAVSSAVRTRAHVVAVWRSVTIMGKRGTPRAGDRPGWRPTRSAIPTGRLSCRRGTATRPPARAPRWT